MSDLEVKPLARAETIPSSWYTDRKFDRLDREAIFRNSWQYLGPASLAASPGSYFLAKICGDPLIVVADEDGEVRCFYNVCRHRGGPLAVEDGCTPHRMLQCQYHGWTYRLDGSLRGMPRFRFVELFDRSDYGLIPVATTLWQGLLFAWLGNDRPADLHQQLQAIPDRSAPIDLTHLRFYRRVSYTIDCNWKVYIDNYLEGYHLPYVHPELCTTLDYRNYRTETADAFSLQLSPLRDSDTLYGGEGWAYYYLVLPNFMLNILPNRLQTNIVLPRGHRRCEVLFDYFYPAGEDENIKNQAARDMELADRVQQEDMDICAHVQKGLESTAYDQGRFSVECEEGVYHFQSYLKQRYRSFLKDSGEGTYVATD